MHLSLAKPSVSVLLPCKSAVCIILWCVDLQVEWNAFKVQLSEILSHQLADALATERTKTDIAIAQVW